MRVSKNMKIALEVDRLILSCMCKAEFFERQIHMLLYMNYAVLSIYYITRFFIMGCYRYSQNKQRMLLVRTKLQTRKGKRYN